MITRKELISSKEYWLVKLQNSLYEEVEKYLVENKITKTDFAKMLGVSKGYISQILNGDFDHKISKLIEISLAIKKVPFLKFENLNKCFYLDSIGALETDRTSETHITIQINYSEGTKIELPKNNSYTGYSTKHKRNDKYIITPADKKIPVKSIKSVSCLPLM